ncbi:MAG: UDP-N-acetylmuramoyl-L-alanine--D-glutamate ligase [Ruminococcaceae bacterium]|nr:UDP-N-acetylmuramoyl-L-alanine--D-glutamate ligase [Oscillospiraceae bacterium]
MKFCKIKEYVNGRSCAVLGLGVSNLPLVRMLAHEGVSVTVYDKCSPEELGKDALELLQGGVRFVVCDKNFDGITEQLIFRSPGIRPDIRGIKNALSSGAELTSEMELFLKLTPARTFAITGSDGKTTSTTLTGLFEERIAKTYVGGNIGTPLLDKCEQMTATQNAVLELSSFQLMTLSAAPERVAITNVSPNHLDWHTGMDEYITAKKNIIGSRTRRLVTNAECDTTRNIAYEYDRDGMEIFLFSSSKVSYDQVVSVPFSHAKAFAIFPLDGYVCVSDGQITKKVLDISRIKLPGKHNVENYMTAIGLTFGDLTFDVYLDIAESFGGVEHRLEWVRQLDGVDYYNSSIDSSPTRTSAALSALASRRIVLICGGYDKKIPYAPLAEAICAHGGIHTVVLTGATGEKIGAEIDKLDTSRSINREYVGDFADAVAYARSQAKAGDCVLLSPASASFDAFKNFAERGNTFKRIVNEF